MKSMEIQSGHSELSVISHVSTVEGCPLSGIPLYLEADPPLPATFKEMLIAWVSMMFYARIHLDTLNLHVGLEM